MLTRVLLEAIDAPKSCNTSC